MAVLAILGAAFILTNMALVFSLWRIYIAHRRGKDPHTP